MVRDKACLEKRLDWRVDIIYMGNFLGCIALFVVWNWLTRECFSGYLVPASKLLGPNKIFTWLFHYKQNSSMETRKSFDSLNYTLCYFETWKFLLFLFERYLKLIYILPGQETADFKYEWKPNNLFLKGHYMLSAYYYRSVLNVSHEVYLFWSWVFCSGALNPKCSSQTVTGERKKKIMVLICCYLRRENYKVLKFHLNNSSYFEISASLF